MIRMFQPLVTTCLGALVASTGLSLAIRVTVGIQWQQCFRNKLQVTRILMVEHKGVGMLDVLQDYEIENCLTRMPPFLTDRLCVIIAARDQSPSTLATNFSTWQEYCELWNKTTQTSRMVRPTPGTQTSTELLKAMFTTSGEDKMDQVRKPKHTKNVTDVVHCKFCSLSQWKHPGFSLPKVGVLVTVIARV